MMKKDKRSKLSKSLHLTQYSEGFPVSYEIKPPHPWGRMVRERLFQRDVIDAFHKAFGERKKDSNANV